MYSFKNSKPLILLALKMTSLPTTEKKLLCSLRLRHCSDSAILAQLLVKC